ncbi:MAG: lytic murein transglycosylase B [Myxococcales bacterium]
MTRLRSDDPSAAFPPASSHATPSAALGLLACAAAWAVVACQSAPAPQPVQAAATEPAAAPSAPASGPIAPPPADEARASGVAATGLPQARSLEEARQEQAVAPVAQAAAPAEPGRYGQRADVARWIAEVAQRHQLDPAWVAQALGEARYQATVARAVLPFPAGTPKNWKVYRSRFVEPRRIKAARAFEQANSRWLQLAEERWGVPQQIIVGLIGVETIYGQQIGSWRALDALATLAFDYPAGAPRDRSPFFRNELEQFLLLCKEQGLRPQDPSSSYAGALGLPQFMPGSWRRWAIDFDGDGHIDLWRSPADAIGSVAHYLAEHGWQRAISTHYPVRIPHDAQALAKLMGPDILPTFRPGQMRDLGAHLPPAAFSHPGLLALVKLENGHAAPQYVLGTENFYAITRYNQSSMYAMAVIELGAAAAGR